MFAWIIFVLVKAVGGPAGIRGAGWADYRSVAPAAPRRPSQHEANKSDIDQELSMMRNRQPSEEVNSNSVYDARWLLVSIFVLALIVAAVGIFQ